MQQLLVLAVCKCLSFMRKLLSGLYGMNLSWLKAEHKLSRDALV